LLEVRDGAKAFACGEGRAGAGGHAPSTVFGQFCMGRWWGEHSPSSRSMERKRSLPSAPRALTSAVRSSPKDKDSTAGRETGIVCLVRRAASSSSARVAVQPPPGPRRQSRPRPYQTDSNVSAYGETSA
jgi:hypothetical protein